MEIMSSSSNNIRANASVLSPSSKKGHDEVERFRCFLCSCIATWRTWHELISGLNGMHTCVLTLGVAEANKASHYGADITALALWRRVCIDAF